MPEEEPKKLSYDEFRNIYIEHATTYWMGINGMDISDPNTSQHELNESDPHSQLSAWKDTASDAFDLFIDALANIEKSGYEVDFDAEPEKDEEGEEDKDELMSVIADYVQDNLGGGGHSPKEQHESQPQRSSGAVTKSNAVFIFMDTPPGEPTYVGDVREWLAEVDSLRIPDSAEVEGQLYLSFDTEFVTGERSECLTCGDEEDILMTVHDCPGEPNNA